MNTPALGPTRAQTGSHDLAQTASFDGAIRNRPLNCGRSGPVAGNWPTLGEPVSVWVADDHPMIVDGLRRMIDGQNGLRFMGSSSNGQEAKEAYSQHRPDVLVIDLQMPDMTGVEAIVEIRREDPSARIVILTSYGGEDDVTQGLEAGASGYLLKDSRADVIVDCIEQVSRGRRVVSSAVADKLANGVGRPRLSTREREVLGLVAAGQCNKLISKTLGISGATTKFHLNNIFTKLRAGSRTEAINIGMKRGIVRP